MNEERTNQPQTAEPSLSEILQVRRDKLKALQDAGRNPFISQVSDWLTVNPRC